jgi:hypothetical protein
MDLLQFTLSITLAILEKRQWVFLLLGLNQDRTKDYAERTYSLEALSIEERTYNRFAQAHGYHMIQAPGTDLIFYNQT